MSLPSGVQLLQRVLQQSGAPGGAPTASHPATTAEKKTAAAKKDSSCHLDLIKDLLDANDSDEETPAAAAAVAETGTPSAAAAESKRRRVN